MTKPWSDSYLSKRRNAAEAGRMIRPGQRVFLSSSCGEPQCLVKAMIANSKYFADLEIVRLLSLETMPLSMMADETEGDTFSVRSFYLGSAKSKQLSGNKRFITPINLSMVPRLFKSRRLPVDVALIQVSPPDDFGWMSLGVSVDVTMAAAQSADLVIAQVNSNMPRILGQSFIHVNEVDVFVECDEPLLSLGPPPEFESAHQIGQHAAKLIEDGSTLQLSLGATPHSLVLALAEKNDLGVHTQFISDSIMKLVSMGVVTNKLKNLHPGKCVASAAVGSKDLYDFLNDNPGISFFPSDYVNDPSVIARNTKMTSINVIMAMDLTGQAAADALPYNHYSGVTGTMDFVRGARYAEAGKSILMLPSTTIDGKSSRIIPQLNDVAVVVPRGDIHYVVTEYGVVNLFGKTMEERAMALISIAHPEFRDELFEHAKAIGLVGQRRTLTESVTGIYPLKIEEKREIGGEEILFRPTKPVDQRMIQEHFYHLDHGDVVKRFLYEKEIFGRTDVAGMLEIDYVRDLTIVAVVGEVGYEKAIALGGYYLDPATNMAEVAFSVSKDWQRKGLSKIIQAKLAKAARDNGIRGLIAYTTPTNHGMIQLFNKLPYKVTSSFEEDMIVLKASLDHPEPVRTNPSE